MATLEEVVTQVQNLQAQLQESRRREEDLNARAQILQGQGAMQATLEEMVNTHRAILDATRKPEKKLTLVDNRGLAKPSNYDGTADFLQWKIRLEAFVSSVHADFEKAMQWGEDEADPISEASMTAEFGATNPAQEEIPDLAAKDAQLYAVLQTLCEKEAFTLVRSAGKGHGLEAWRRLCKRYDPSTGGTRRALLKSVLSPNKCSKVEEPSAAVENWEDQVRQYENRRKADGTRPTLDEDIKISILEPICPTEVERHLQLNQARFADYQEVRKELSTCLETRIGLRLKAGAPYNPDPNGPGPMDIGALDKKGKKCHNCGKLGHFAADCATKGANSQASPGGKKGNAKGNKGGKGSGKPSKGGGKGKNKGSKGKGKAMGNVEGGKEEESRPARTDRSGRSDDRLDNRLVDALRNLPVGGAHGLHDSGSGSAGDGAVDVMMRLIEENYRLRDELRNQQRMPVRVPSKSPLPAPSRRNKKDEKWKKGKMGDDDERPPRPPRRERSRSREEPRGRPQERRHWERFREPRDETSERELVDRTAKSKASARAPSSDEGGDVDEPKSKKKGFEEDKKTDEDKKAVVKKKPRAPSAPIDTSATRPAEPKHPPKARSTLSNQLLLEADKEEDEEKKRELERQRKELNGRTPRTSVQITEDNMHDQSFHDSRYYSDIARGRPRHLAWKDEKNRRRAILERRKGVKDRARERLDLDQEWHEKHYRANTGRKKEDVDALGAKMETVLFPKDEEEVLAKPAEKKKKKGPRVRGKDYYVRKNAACRLRKKAEKEKSTETVKDSDEEGEDYDEDEDAKSGDEADEPDDDGEPEEEEEEPPEEEPPKKKKKRNLNSFCALQSFCAPPGGSPGERHVLEERNGWRRIEVNLDTGAAATAIPADLDLKGYHVSPPHDVSYKTASAESLADEGGVVLKGTDAMGMAKVLEGRVTGVHRTLAHLRPVRLERARTSMVEPLTKTQAKIQKKRMRLEKSKGKWWQRDHLRILRTKKSKSTEQRAMWSIAAGAFTAKGPE
eukprot:Skav203984  [mRNA]  locus=scaffold3369:57215:60998:- [translate_table: standard]